MDVRIIVIIIENVWQKLYIYNIISQLIRTRLCRGTICLPIWSNMLHVCIHWNVIICVIRGICIAIFDCCHLHSNHIYGDVHSMDNNNCEYGHHHNLLMIMIIIGGQDEGGSSDPEGRLCVSVCILASRSIKCHSSTTYILYRIADVHSRGGKVAAMDVCR